MGRLTTYDKKGEAWVDFIQIPNALDKLAHYEDLEEAGRLIELPCAVGDTIYHIDSYLRKGEDTLYWEYEVKEQTLNNTYQCFMLTHVKGEIFLTKEEAERKLAELKGE